MEIRRITAKDGDYAEVNAMLSQGWTVQCIMPVDEHTEFVYLVGPKQVGPSETKEGVRRFFDEIKSMGFMGKR